MVRTLTRSKARWYYDRFGAKQDQQGFYEDRPLERLIKLGKFSEAQGVLEFGCGTGRLAEQLLKIHLPATANYVGIDLSSTMVRLATDRLAVFGDRHQVMSSEGGFELGRYGDSFDRIVATYVLDLLSPNEIQQFLTGAHATLAKGGLLCVAGLTKGTGVISTSISTIWTLIHRINPAWVGGCRPLELADTMPQDQWQLIQREVVVASGIPSEVVIAVARDVPS